MASSPHRAGVSDRPPRAEDSGGPRSLAADRPSQEHAAAARLHVLRAQLRRVVVPRLRREARAGGPRAVEALGPQRHGRAERLASRKMARRPEAAAGGRDRRAANLSARTSRPQSFPRRTARRPGVGGGFDQSQGGRPPSQEPPVAPRRQRRRRARRRSAHGARHQRALADVPPQRQADPARGRFRRAELRIRRTDGSAEGLSARRAGAGRARSTRRPARVPGPGDAAHRGRNGSRRRCRHLSSEPETIDVHGDSEPIEAEPIEAETVTVVDTTAELLGRATASPDGRGRRVAQRELRRESAHRRRRAEAGQRRERGRRAARDGRTKKDA